MSDDGRRFDPMGGLPTPAELEAIAIEVVTEAAATIRTASRALALETKSSPTDPVTALDLEVERLVQELLHGHTPGADFLGEERGQTIGQGPLGWILDPIDGTVNLTYDLPVIGVSLAATLHGEVVAGAVADVWRSEVYSAATGKGARRDGSSIHVSAVGSLHGALVATGFAYSTEGRASEAEVFGRILPVARDIRCFGSSAVQLCWLACGRIDAFYQRNMQRWDYAAGALIARESGATIEFPGDGNTDLMVAASPAVFGALRDLAA